MIHDQKSLTVRAVHIHTFQYQSSTVDFRLIHKIVEDCSVRRQPRRGGTGLIGKWMKGALILYITQEILVPGIVIVASMRMGGSVQYEAP